jgi:RNA polymerase sigma-70 factor (ECF subfamily)
MKNDAGQLTEKDLMSGIRSGNGKTLQIVFKMYHSLLCATAFRMVQDREVAKDIVQEVFIRFWNRHASLPEELDLKAYLYKSTINGALNHLKQINKNQMDNLDGTDEIAGSQSTEDSLYFNDLQTAINYTIDTLPPVCRSVFMLSRFDYMSNVQIASHLEISLKSVEKHMTKALKSLRSVLGKQNK